MKSKASAISAAITVSGLILTMNVCAAPDNGMPATHNQGDVTYVTGGVGQTEADAMKHAAQYYPLEIEFLLKAKPKDEYLAGVKVRIKDAHEKMVLNATADGPFLLARLPAGKYTISAERDRKIEQRQIEVSAKEHRRVVFEWQS